MVVTKELQQFDWKQYGACALWELIEGRGVARISVQGEHSAKITQRKLLKIFWKIYIKFAQKLKKFPNFIQKVLVKF